jgi:hypothetical protein
MSTLEIACGRCNKRFRVRAEFAGKTTRCPGCSAPLIVGATTVAAPPLPLDDDAPRRRSRPRPIEEDAPRPEPDHDWQSVNTALRREQTALFFVALQVVCDLFLLLLAMTLGPIAGNGPFIMFALLLGFAPSLAAGVLGIMARIAALAAPTDARVRGSAMCSLLLAIATLLAMVGMGLLYLIQLEGSRFDDVLFAIAIGGTLLAALASVGTFSIYTVQVGVVRRSRDVASALGRLGIAATICVFVLLAGGVFASLMELISAPSPSYYGNPYGGYGYPYGGYSYRPRYGENIARVLLMGGIPLSAIVFVVMYHRLLAAARRALDRAPRG